MFYGAILGDYIGSRFEFIEWKRKDFELFDCECSYTDDSIMTLAVMEACQRIKNEGYEVYEQVEQYFTEAMQKWGRAYPYVKGGYGSNFANWIFNDNPKPYGSYGNGAAMRASPCGWMFDTLEEVEKFAEWSAKPTHNHPEGLKAARVTAGCVFLARTHHSKRQIYDYIKKNGYKLEKCDKVRPNYHFDVTCQGTMPVALEAFIESSDFESAIRIAMSMGGDADTIGAITGAIAEAFYGLPDEFKKKGEEIVKQILDNPTSTAGYTTGEFNIDDYI